MKRANNHHQGNIHPNGGGFSPQCFKIENILKHAYAGHWVATNERLSSRHPLHYVDNTEVHPPLLFTDYYWLILIPSARKKKKSLILNHLL